MVTKLTQLKAANLALREMLERAEADGELTARMDRAKAGSPHFGHST